MAKELKVNNVEIVWLGHASVRIRSGDKTVYIDPYSGKYSPADLVLVTHDHYDHCDKNKISQACGSGTAIVAPQKAVDAMGRGKVISAGQTIEEKGVKVTAVPAYNIGKLFHPKGVGVGFVVEINGVRIYHAGDTDFIPEMCGLENIDVALLPIGGTYTMNAKQALEANKAINPKHAVPIHYASLDMLAKTAEGFEAPNVVVLEPI